MGVDEGNIEVMGGSMWKLNGKLSTVLTSSVATMVYGTVLPSIRSMFVLISHHLLCTSVFL